MSVVRCSCGVLIEWLITGSGKRAPFLHQLVKVADAPDDAWTVIKMPFRGERRALVVPLAGVSGHLRAAIRHVLIRHDCPNRRLTSQESPPAATGMP